jgi:predicted GNAT family acetyltransferase
MKAKRLQSEQKGAYLSYHIHQIECVWEILHVYVPKLLRNRGIAERLTKEAIRQAKLKGMLVKPTCTYVSETFLTRFPEFTEDCILVNSGEQHE